MLSQSLLIKCHAKQSLARGLLVRNYLVSYSLESYVYPRGDLSSFIATFQAIPPNAWASSNIQTYPLSRDKPGQIGSRKSVVDIASHGKGIAHTMSALETHHTGPIFGFHCNVIKVG